MERVLRIFVNLLFINSMSMVAFSQSFTIDKITYRVLSNYNPNNRGSLDNLNANLGYFEGNTDSTKQYVELLSCMLSGEIEILPEVVHSEKTYSVIAVAAKAFQGNRGVQKVTLPYSITHVGKKAFSECKKLRQVWLASGLLELGEGCFQDSPQLQQVSELGEIKSIPKNCFAGCERLTTVSLPENIETLGNGAFKGCKSLQSIELPDNLKRIEQLCFSGCEKLQYIDLPERVDSLERNCFGECRSLTSIKFGSKIRTLPTQIFYKCAMLKDIRLPEKLTSIGAGAFINCTELTSIDIPSTVKEIGQNCFQGCQNLMHINITPDNMAYSAVQDVLMDKAQTVIIKAPEAFEGVFDCPQTVKHILPGAFSNCTQLQAIHFNPQLEIIGTNAFAGCTNITQIDLPYNIKLIEDGAFMNCIKMKAITIPDPAAEHVNMYYTSYEQQTSTLANGYLNKINSLTFAGCKSLTTITLPSSTRAVIEDAFAGCNSLKEINIMSLQPPAYYQTSNASRPKATLWVMPNLTARYRKIPGWSSYTIAEFETEEEVFYRLEAERRETERLKEQEAIKELQKAKKIAMKKKKNMERNRLKGEKEMMKQKKKQELDAKVFK